MAFLFGGAGVSQLFIGAVPVASLILGEFLVWPDIEVGSEGVSISFPGAVATAGLGADVLSVSILNTGVDIDSPGNSASWVGGGVVVGADAVCASVSSASAGAVPVPEVGALSVSILNTGVDVDSPSNSYSWVSGSVVPLSAAGALSVSVIGGGAGEESLQFGSATSVSAVAGELRGEFGAPVLSVSILNTGVDVDSPSNSYSWIGGGAVPSLSGGADSYSAIQVNPCVDEISAEVFTGPFNDLVDIEISPDGSFIYVADLVGNAVRFVDTATMGVVINVPVTRPRYLAISEDGRQLYVYADFDGGKFFAIDTGTGLIRSIVVNGGDEVVSGGICTGGGIIYTGFRGGISDPDGSVAVGFRATDGVAVWQSDTMGIPNGIQRLDGRYIYVCDNYAGAVVAFDSVTGLRSWTVDLPFKPDTISAGRPGTNRLYVTGSNTNSVVVLDTESRATFSLIVGTRVARIVGVASGTGRVFVPEIGGGASTVSVLDGLDHSTIATVIVADNPLRAVSSEDGLRAYVIHPKSISVITTVPCDDNEPGDVSTPIADAGVFSGSALDTDANYDQTVVVAATQVVEIPLWVNKIDALAVGGGAGSSGSVILSVGAGGKGGRWGVSAFQVKTMLINAGIAADAPTRLYAEVVVGGGGAGGRGDLLTIQFGQPGLQTTIDFFAVVGGVKVPIGNSVVGPGGTPSSQTASITQVQQVGGAATDGNASGGKDYLLNNRTYVGGGATTIPGLNQNSTAANAPGGAAGGKGSGNQAGNGGADGRAWIRMYSDSSAGSQQSWTTAGGHSLELDPQAAEFVYPLVLGGGGGGAGGRGFPSAVAGEGGTGGTWNYVRTAPGYWTVTTLLAQNGLTRAGINRLWLSATVGAGGGGGAGTVIGAAANDGGNGIPSKVSLMCRTTAGVQVELAVVTGSAGGGGVNSNRTDPSGKAVQGGNINLSGGLPINRDMRFLFQGKQYTFLGGAATSGGLGNLGIGSAGNPPGGGGSGGLIGTPISAGTNGMRGAAGAVHVVFA